MRPFFRTSTLWKGVAVREDDKYGSSSTTDTQQGRKTDNLWTVSNAEAPFSTFENLCQFYKRKKQEAEINLEPTPKCHPAVAESLRVVKHRKDLTWIKFSM